MAAVAAVQTAPALLLWHWPGRDFLRESRPVRVKYSRHSHLHKSTVVISILTRQFADGQLRSLGIATVKAVNARLSYPVAC